MTWADRIVLTKAAAVLGGVNLKKLENEEYRNKLGRRLRDLRGELYAVSAVKALARAAKVAEPTEKEILSILRE